MSVTALRPPAARSAEPHARAPWVQTAPARNRFYRPELDALRFFAFLGVFAVHVGNYPIEYLEERHIPRALAEMLMGIVRGGAYGVDVFFTLSAYLITELLLREKARFGRLDVPAFYLRRMLRIWPLYYLAVMVAACVPFFNPGGQFDSRYVIPFLLFFGNWSFVWYGWPITPADPLWSVSIEEQFYLLWPPLVARLTRRGIFYTSLAMIVIANVARISAAAMGGGKEHLWANTFAHLDTIAVGIMLATWLRGEVPELSLRTRSVMIALGLASFSMRGYFIMLPDGDRLSVLGTLFGYPAVMLGCAAILMAFIGLPMRSPALRYLGKISYGLYVYHQACVLITDRFLPGDPGLPHALLRLLVVLTLTVAVSALSYRLIESPFLSLKRRFTFVESRPV
ncbi:MAG: acyltransferase [Steroidobacteraceae bacterium]